MRLNSYPFPYLNPLPTAVRVCVRLLALEGIRRKGYGRSVKDPVMNVKYASRKNGI